MKFQVRLVRWLTALLIPFFVKITNFACKIPHEIMVMQTNPFTYRQIGIQTVCTQNFRQIFQILHGKKINPKLEKLRCIQLTGWPQNESGKTSRALRGSYDLPPAIVLGSLQWLCGTPHSTFCNYVSMSPCLLMLLTPLHSFELF